MIYKIGDSIISPLGMTTDATFEAVCLGESRLSFHENIFGLPDPCFISLLDEARIDNAFNALTDFGTEGYTKVEKAAILAAAQAIDEANIDAAREDVLFILSTTKGNVDLLEENPYEPERPYLWRSAQIIAEFFDNPNTPIVVSNACISGCAAQIEACRQLRHGGYKYAVVIGAEMLSKFVISGFQSFKALSPERCKPFGADRCGLNLGDAAAAIVYTKGDENTVLDDGTLVVLGGAINNDANHISGPSRTGEGLLRAINRATDGYDLNRLAFINAHGTATVYNDDMESIAIQRAGLQDVFTNSLKGYFGHTLGAAGILETILSARALKDHRVIGTKGTEQVGTAATIKVCQETQPVEGDCFMKLISGFGGSNAAMLFAVVNGERRMVNGKLRMVYSKSDCNKPSISIVSSCVIDNEKVMVNGDVLVRREGDGDWLVDIYHNINMQYPKFFKMDNLCKAGTLAAEILLKDIDFNREEVKDDWAIVLMNSASSLDDDRRYQQTISDKDNYYPSPAIFVYTLANIITGEIAIRHKIGGETSFYVLPSFDKEKMMEQIAQTFTENPKLTHIICGWADYDNGNCNIQLFLTQRNNLID